LQSVTTPPAALDAREGGRKRREKSPERPRAKPGVSPQDQILIIYTKLAQLLPIKAR